MAVQVLPISNERGVGTAGCVEFTLAGNTLVWVHGANGDDVLLGLDAKGSDGKFSGIADMTAQGISRSGVLPAGDYRITRLRGTCGFQRAA